jgi:glycyl-tRNA synthetase beta subunit
MGDITRMEKQTMVRTVFEIYSEEIPSRFQESARLQLEKLAQDFFQEKNMTFQQLQTFVTPRRLTLLIDGLPKQGFAFVIEKKGPCVTVAQEVLEKFCKNFQASLPPIPYEGSQAFDQECIDPSVRTVGAKISHFTQGDCLADHNKDLCFGKGPSGIKEPLKNSGKNVLPVFLPHHCTQRTTEKGTFWWAQYRHPGYVTKDLLAHLYAYLLSGIRWPKSMFWGNSKESWVRPIRNLLCLYEEKDDCGGSRMQVIPFVWDLQGVALESTGVTYGNGGKSSTFGPQKPFELPGAHVQGFDCDQDTQADTQAKDSLVPQGLRQRVRPENCPIPVTSIDEYKSLLWENKVVLCSKKRRFWIQEQTKKILHQGNLGPRDPGQTLEDQKIHGSIRDLKDKDCLSDTIDCLESSLAQDGFPPHAWGVVPEMWKEGGLLDEVVGLVEWPQVFQGFFNPDYLEMPDPVIITCMKNHQRYFPLHDQVSGKLVPSFLVCSNQSFQDGGLEALRGYERVLDARLSDGLFFFNQDRGISLKKHGEKLDERLFFQDLGTIGHKVKRLEELACFLEKNLKKSELPKGSLIQVAQIAKSDLCTQMVQEFPELQGIMGHYYALEEGLDAGVALALEEHYFPQSEEDFSKGPCHISLLGRSLGLLDRCDYLIGLFGKNCRPTGSRDPFALRRCAGAIIFLSSTLDVSLMDILEYSFKIFQSQGFLLESSWEGLRGSLKDFLGDRIAYLLKKGLLHDVGHGISFDSSSLGEEQEKSSMLESLGHPIDPQKCLASLLSRKPLGNALNIYGLLQEYDFLRKVWSSQEGILLLAVLKRGMSFLTFQQGVWMPQDGSLNPKSSVYDNPEGKLLKDWVMSVQAKDWKEGMDFLKYADAVGDASLKKFLEESAQALKKFLDHVLIKDPDPVLAQEKILLLDKCFQFWNRLCCVQKLLD